jgi:periplasmic divalent cation tolerance protein
MNNSSLKKAVLFYVTFPNIEEARNVSKLLVNLDLVACTNIFPQVESVYKWNNKVEFEAEVIVLMKTIQNNSQKVEEVISKNHSYKIPCIIQINTDKINAEYLKWINDVTTI